MSKRCARSEEQQAMSEGLISRFFWEWGIGEPIKNKKSSTG